MTLSEIIKSNAWLSVKLTLERLFPDQHELLDDYEKVFYELRTMQPAESNVTIDVHWVHDDYDDTDYVDVSGYYTNPADRTDEYSNSLAIEFTTWQEWLGMPVDQKSLKEFSELELIAYCLDELTYAGFEQDEIQAEMNRIKKIADDFNKLSPEKKAKNTYTWEEVKKKFGIEDEKPEDNEET